MKILPILIAFLSLLAGACVYRVDVQQGNLLEEDEIAAVKVGMTRNQVRFLLGTPMVKDTFHSDRWDYMYFFRRGRNNFAEQRWMIVYFDGDTVRDIRRDVPVNPI